MLAEILKSRFLLMAAALPPLLVLVFFAVSGSRRQSGDSGLSLSSDTVSPNSVEMLKDSLAKDRQLLVDYEREQMVLRTEVIKRRKLFQEGQLAQDQVAVAEKSFVASLKRVHEMRHRVDEADIAITEAVLGENVLRMPALPENGFSETTGLVRFNGGFRWSLKEAPRLEKYFSQAFGRKLPVTAIGQTMTHNRLGFDHRDALDVAVHPDSAEGKAFISHLRKTGIPFTAFRDAVTGTSTGPHIHIGRPSGRLRR